MTTTFKKVLPYVLTSIFVIGLWRFFTWTDNYAWNPNGKDILMLDIALTSIFYYKIIFWLVVANLTVFSFRLLIDKKSKMAALTALLTIMFYFTVGQMVDNKCAIHYYTVFQNQSVTEEYIQEPILKAGFEIGPILTEKIANKEMGYRRYAIDGLGKIKYNPATQTLAKILLDKGELDVVRADAFQVLTSFDTDESRKIVSKFKQQAIDTSDMKVIALVDYWMKQK